MRFDFVAALWGDWHIGMFDRVMLPTFASAGNLQAVLAEHQARLRILTRRKDFAALDALPSVNALRRMLPVELVAASESERVAPIEHQAWWTRAADEAREAGAALFNLPPDVAFADGAIAFLCAQLAAGKLAALAPAQLRVVSESCSAEIGALSTGPPWRPVAIPPRQLVRMGIRHLHPLVSVCLEGIPHGAPNVTHYWPVPGEGVLFALTTEEVMALRPEARVRDMFRLDDSVGLDQVSWAASSDEAFFLSLAPLAKDTGLYLEGLPLDARLTALWSMHPTNDTALGLDLAARPARILHSGPTPEKWAAAEAEAAGWARRMRAWRSVWRVWAAAQQAGCRWGCRFLGLAAHLLDLPALAGPQAPATLFLPTDAAIAQPLRPDLAALALPGGEPALTALLPEFAAPGRHPLPPPGGRTSLATASGRVRTLETDATGRCLVDGHALVSGSFEAGGHLVHLVDALLEPLTREVRP